MGFERGPADQAHRHRRGGEHADFCEDHRAHRQAKPPQRDEIAPSGPPGQGERSKPPQSRLDERGQKQDQEHQGLRQRGCNAGADDSERRHAKLAKHQSIIGEGVESHGHQTGD